MVAERLQAAGFQTYRAMDITGIDLLARSNGLEVTVQVKYARRIANHIWQVGGKHGSARNIRIADWLLAVLPPPDRRIMVIPKKNIHGARATFDDRLVHEFNPFNWLLFTEVVVYTDLDESELAHTLPTPAAGYANTGAYYVEDNRCEIYAREVFRVSKRTYSQFGEDIYIQIVVRAITRNVLHEMMHAAGVGPENHAVLNEVAMAMITVEKVRWLEKWFNVTKS